MVGGDSFHGECRPGEHEPDAGWREQQCRSGSRQSPFVRARTRRLASSQSIWRTSPVPRMARRRPPSRFVREVRPGLVLRLLRQMIATAGFERPLLPMREGGFFLPSDR